MGLDFDRLSRRERDCLALVDQGLSSKQIAIIMGIRPDSVDRLTGSARAKLGDLPRREAARAFMAHERGRNLSTSPEDDPQKSGPRFLGEAKDDGMMTNPDFAVADKGAGQNGLRFATEFGGRYRNGIGFAPTWLMIVLIAAGGCLTVGAGFSLLTMLDRLLSGH